MPSGQPVCAPLTGHTDYVRSLDFHPDGRLLASAGFDCVIRLWDVTQLPTAPRCVQVLEGHEKKLSQVVFSPDGKLLASGSDDGTVRVWDVASGQTIATLVDDEQSPAGERKDPIGGGVRGGGGQGGGGGGAGGGGGRGAQRSQ